MKKICFLDYPNLFFGEEKYLIDRYILVFVCIYKQFPQLLESIDIRKITDIFDKTQWTRYEYIFILLYEYKIRNIWKCMSPFMKEKFKRFLEIRQSSNKDKKQEHSIPALLLFLDEITTENLKNKYHEMKNDEKLLFINKIKDFGIIEIKPIIIEFIKQSNIDKFSSSGSYQGGRENGEMLIKPILYYFNPDDIKKLLNGVLSLQIKKPDKRNQLIDCEYIFESLFYETTKKYPEILDEWKNFVEESNWPSSIKELIEKEEKALD